MKIRTQLLLGAALLALVLLVIAASLVTTTAELGRLEAQVQAADRVGLAASDLAYLANEYLLYGEPRQAERWTARYAALGDEIANLSARTPAQQTLVAAIAEDRVRLKNVFDGVAADRASRPPGPADPATLPISWSRVGVQTQGLAYDAGRLSDLLNAEADATRSANTVQMTALLGGFAAFGLFGVAVVGRRTLASVAALQAGADVVGAGNLGHTVPVTGDDEVADLARSFNRMATDLATVTASRAELEQEVDHRESAEAALRESEERYRGIVETAEEGIALHAADGTITYVNRRMAEMLGYPTEEIVGRSSRDFVDREERPNVIEAREHLEGHGSFSGERRMRRKDGSVLWTLANLTARRDGAGAVIGYLAMHSDITERKRAEAAVAASEAKYRELFERMAEAFALHEIVLDGSGAPVDYRFQAVNPAFEAMTGYAADTIVGCTARELHPEIEPWCIEQYGQVAMTGKSDHFEACFSPLGRWYDVHVYSPGPGQFASAFFDITERRRAEAALRESEAKYRNAVELSPDAILIHQDATIVFANPATAALVGVDGPGALVGRPILDLIHPDARDLVAANIEQDLRGEESPLTPIDILRDDGATVPVQGRGATVPFGGRPAVQVVLRDVTEERRVEEELRQSREWFRVMGETVPYGVWRCNAHGGAEYASQSFLDLLEMTQEEMREFGWTHRLPPDEVEPMLERWRHCVETGEDWDDEHHILGPDGVYHTVLTRGRPVRDQDGAIVAWVGINLDIDDRTRAEEALREYAENLRRSNEDLERFAYVSSHDLQEPLRSIVSFSQLLERRYRGKLDQDANEYLDFIVEGGNRMQSLILDLLAYSRVNTTHQDLHSTDTEDVLAAVERHLDLQLREAGAVITHDEMPAVLADPLQLEQVFANLVSNAIKFRRPEEPLRIHIGAQRTDGFWEFAVSDNGIGIAPEYFDRIFVIFQRLHTKDRYDGTGIGLAIVKRIIDRHGGTVRVVSMPGEGSTFFFTLPAA